MARDELERVTAKYCTDASVPLEQRLLALPMEAWENDFQFLDVCLRECIRFTAQGCGFRKNTTGDLKLSTGEVVPLGAYVVRCLTAINNLGCVNDTLYRPTTLLTRTVTLPSTRIRRSGTRRASCLTAQRTRRCPTHTTDGGPAGTLVWA